MSIVLDLVIKTILCTQCCQSRLCQYVCQEKLWITLSHAWYPQFFPQTSHTVSSSCSNPCPPDPQKNSLKTIPDNLIDPTFYKLNLGRAPSMSSSAQSSCCRDMGAFHRHYLLHRHPQECLHNLQPKSGCVLPVYSLLQTKFFCH